VYKTEIFSKDKYDTFIEVMPCTMNAMEQPTEVADNTYTRFLNATEQLFAEHGYDGTKIRAIAKLSNSNLGVLSHYWGSKQALFHDVFERRFRPVYEDHIKRFRDLEVKLDSGGNVDVIDVLRAQIEPIFLMTGSRPDESQWLRLLFGRALTDPSNEVVEAMGEIFTPAANLFFQLLRRVSPDIDHTEFYWRANCVVGAFTFVETYTERLTKFIHEDVSNIDWMKASEHVVAFLAAGMQAPATPAQQGKGD
jgi:AcrR family transcriptional regulator